MRKFYVLTTQLAALLFVSCATGNKNQDIMDSLKRKADNLNLCDYSQIYVLDEYSCGACFNNVVSEIANSRSDYVILFATQMDKPFTFQESQLVGFVEESKVQVISYEIVSELRAATNTIKGNYGIQVNACEVETITNF